MRLAYLCFDFGVPVQGTKGAAVHLRETVDALRQLGHTVQVFSTGSSHEEAGVQWDDWSAVALNGFASEVVRLLTQEDLGQPSRLVREWRALLMSEYSQKTLLSALSAFQPDAIYERYSLFAYAGVELARRLRVPLILEVNAPLAHEQARYRELVLRRTATEIEKKVLNSADAVIVVSTALADHAVGLGVSPDRITVLPNGVNPTRFDPSVSGEEIRSHYNLQGRRVIGFVGSLKPWHDLDTLSAGVGLLARTDERFHLLAVGEGPEAARLRAIEEDYVTCTGAVPYDQTPRFMAAMDAIVVPYPAGGEQYFSPLKLYEAMAMAKPVVGARVGQVQEVMVDSVTGLLYEPGSAEDLAHQASRLFEQPDWAFSMGAAARKSVLIGGTWDHNARRIAAIAESVKAAWRAA